MSKLIEFLTFEHESEHNLLLKNLFSAPKIYNANGDLNKRWYVYFSYRNPKTGKLQRLQNLLENYLPIIWKVLCLKKN